MDKPTERVGLGLRLLALGIDSLLWSLSIGLTVGVILPFFVEGNFDDLLLQSDQRVMSFMATSFGVMLIYSYLDVLLRATPGKLVTSIRICDQSGGEATTKSLMVRFLLKNSLFLGLFTLGVVLTVTDNPHVADIVGLLLFVSQVLALVMLLGFLGALRKSKLALHDYLSGTAVYLVEGKSKEIPTIRSAVSRLE